jgi:hypothetical protein
MVCGLLKHHRSYLLFATVAIANAAGLISTNVFRAQDEPKYVPALATSAAFGGFCAVLVLATGMWMRFENARRNRIQGRNVTFEDVNTKDLDGEHRDQGYRYMY